MAHPTISYILLTYNQSVTVAEAVQSVLAQTGTPLEIVITDDASVDDTFAVVEAVVADYTGPHTVILNRNAQNLGLSGNIEKAHELSTGDVLIAAAGDDISLPHRATRIAEAFATDAPPLLLCSHAYFIGPDGAELSGKLHIAALYDTTDLTKIARSKALYIGATGAWHRSLYDSYGPIEADAYEDLVMGFRAALEGRVCVLPERLVKYRLRFGITPDDYYDMGLAKFTARRAYSYTVNAAVMRQRIKDALKFGLTQDNAVLKVLRVEAKKAALGQAYYSGGFRQAALRQPLLAMLILRAERRQMRKFRRAAQTAKQG
ncbi:glycosyltransferase [Sulfitobacter guttiformis]|uniref:Glycosyltransferase involved in cell wall biosynthesis n=1 Tax=Sulfitobacter guttiformis TaxID=74349 RepID=A0A420DK64_9RHOB|nr:glycosyltransferase [Sulfitobacter guttiformis]KIN71528.1 putative glycosyl transferase [Sulfitobacter guttiformis KCTC 32187]RKE94633.1 glycosyltransferase involved in cell wall biosynthesis [Sulfitobacter guttiformis]